MDNHKLQALKVNTAPGDLRESHQRDTTDTNVTAPLGGLLWRQSMIHDILRCPRMAAESWIYDTSGNSLANSPIENDGKRGFIAAVFGTAAHKVIEEYNLAMTGDSPLCCCNGKPRTLGYMELLSTFESSAEHEYDVTQDLIPIPKKCGTFTEAMQSVGADYMQYIMGHIAHEAARKPNPIVTASEQKFAMFIEYDSEVYLFTGMIDQLAVIQETNQLLLRDFKFRDAAFKPSWRQLQVDPQMIIYSVAMKWGVPTCSECEPRYAAPGYLAAPGDLMDSSATLTFERRISYSGPCDKCKDKIGTHVWPARHPDAGELIWMKDYRILKRSTAYRNKGETAGQGVYDFKFNAVNEQAYMLDIMQHCQTFRHGIHPRKYGEACKFWCGFAKECVELLIND